MAIREGTGSREGRATGGMSCGAVPVTTGGGSPPPAAVFGSLDWGPWRPQFRRFEGPEAPGDDGAMETAGLRVGPCPTAGACGYLKQVFFQGRLDSVRREMPLFRMQKLRKDALCPYANLF